MATLTPVDFDPFAAAAPAPARKLTPVDYDPFASTGSPDAQSSTTPPPTEAPSLLQRLGAGAMGLLNLARDPVAPVVEGLGGANLWDAIKRGSASALASTLHTGADVVDQAMLPTRMLYGDNPLGADKVAAQSLAVEKQINADRQSAQAEIPRPGLGDLVTNPVEGVRKAAAYYGNTGAESLPMLALALATRNPELGSAMMGAATGAQEYTDLRSQGVPRREAAAAGALTGATEKIGESIGLPAVMGKVGSGTLRRAVATEGGQEGLTQLMQQYIDDQATGNQTSIKDQLLGALDAAVVGGALGGGGHVAINVPEMVSALTGRTAGTPPPLPGQVVEPLASTSTPAVAAPVEAAPAPDDLDTMLAALLAGRADTAPEPAPVPQQVEAPAAAAPASLGEAVVPQMPQAGAMTPADVRAAMDRARVAAEAAQSAPPTPAAPMQAPEASAPVAPKPAPLVDDRASVEALRNEIGWETRGGQMIRGGEVDGDISSGASFGRTSGEVIGRTPWVGKPGPDGESNFWRMRPEQGGKISEKQAHVALDKYAAGQSLNAKERRFIDYARGVAKQYDDAYEADRAQFEQDQADMAEADRVRAVQELRDHQADLSRDDDGEALTLAQWVRRAHDAGVSSEKIIDATWDGSVAEQARRLSRHIADQETNRGTDTRATPIGGEGGAGQDQARPAAAGSGVAESTQGFQLEADRPAASIEGARPVASQRGLFAEPTSSDHNRAAIEAKDAQRNGLNGGRADTGDGGLFDGPRPQQADIEGEAGRASANEPKLTDFADEPRQRSIARGNEDADRLGLRAAVREALGPVADRVEYLHGYEGLPDKMRRGVESRNALGRKGVTAAMYSPDTGRVFIFTQVTKTPARAVWHAAHEIAGHEGLRALLGDRINPALNIARQNPTVKALADEIYAQRKIAEQMKKSGKTHADGVLLATEEALAELAAAVRTGNYEHINERYGVNVPPGIRESVKAAIANFLRRLKAMIDDLFGKHVFTDEDVRSLLEAAWQAAKGKGKGATASVEHPDGSSSLEQVVFHGTPHTVDKFSLQKIGTGEGAQAYGWGMYFASERAIAEHYRDNVKDMGRIAEINAELRSLARVMGEESIPGAYRKYRTDRGREAAKKYDALMDERDGVGKAKGNLYRVDVPEDNDLLDWDKPLSEQPADVVDRLHEVAGRGEKEGDDVVAQFLDDATDKTHPNFDANGRHLYEVLSDAYATGRQDSNPKAASEYLNSIGIPGLRYLDGASRSRPLKDVKREFLSELPEDASAQDVSDLLGTGKFSPKNEALLKALEDDDWLGFDYPAQAVSVALGGELGNFDASPELRQAVADAQEGGTHNYVIWDESAIGQPQSALDSTEDQTDTPAFRKWFGDSKVVDADGKPLVVYHGTPDARFDTFNPQAHFTENPEYASVYTHPSASSINVHEKRAEAPAVIPVYLSIKHPLDTRNAADRRVFETQFRGKWGNDTPLSDHGLPDWTDGRDIAEWIEETGQPYDGYVLDEGGTPEGGHRGVSWVPMRPEQIKSATGNRGTFDPSSPSILESTTHRTPADAQRDAAVRRAEAQRTLGGPTAGGAIGWNFDTHKWEGNEGTLRRARTQLDDKMLAWRDVQENIAQALGRTIPDAQNVYRLENLMHGRVKEGIDALEADRIVPLVQAMDRAKVTPAQLDEYLYARHAKERNAQIASINAAMPDGGSGMTNAEADAILARADTARMAPLARRVDALTHQTRRRLLDSGLITQEQFDAMEAQYQHYVPLRGKQVRENEFDGASQGAGRGLDTRPSPVKSALGRGAGNRAENILGEIIGDAQRSIIASEKARVGRAVMRLVLANPNPALWSVEPVQTERKLDATGEVYEAVVHDWSDPSIIAVRHRGKVYKVQINFAPLAQALNMVGVDQLSGLTRAAGALNRYFSSVLTRYNPAFIPVNAARDALFGLTGMSVEHGELAAMQAALYYPKAIRAAWKEARRAPPTTEADRFAREFAEDGGKTGYVHMPSVEDLARKIGDGRLGSYNPHGIARAGRALADMVGAMNDSVENALRLSAYATLRKRGMSREAAAAYAKEMTVNFNRKGYAGSKLNAWLLFYNASMQGAKRTVTLAKHPKTWAYLGALAAAQVAAVMYGMGQDDDDGTPIWDKVPDYVKQRNLVFTWLDDGGQQHLLTIPMPYGFNIMPYLAGRVTDAMMHREDRPQDSGMAIAADVMSASVQSFSPVPLDDGALGLVPTALRIPLSIQVNRNDWGRQIRKENPFGKFDVPRSTVGRPDTLEIFKVASKGLNRIGGGDDYTPPPMSAFDLAPEDIQYIVDKLGGGAGKFVVDVATLGQMAAGDAPVTSRDVPIVNRFTKTVDDKAAQQAMFYDRRETIERSLDKLRDTFERDGEQAALAMIKDSPELKGADFKRYKTTRDGHVAGQVIVSDGRPQIVVADDSAVFGRYKAASKVVSDQNEAIRSAYTAAPMTLIPNAQRDAAIRSHAQTRTEAQKAFNAAWNRDVVAGGE